MQNQLFPVQQQNDFISIQEAGHWATLLLGKNITSSNILYLVQYGRIKKFSNNGALAVSKKEVLSYYESYSKKRQELWQKSYSENLNWNLSFEQYKESETTKHVHRLHPYKGKFIPQLVEYFLDEHIDNFKKEIFFNKGDIILDPFCGSGTTLVQSNELGMHAIGVDISEFNAMIANAKVTKVDVFLLEKELQKISDALNDFTSNSKLLQFENILNTELSDFNKKYFPSPEFKIDVRKKRIDEKKYSQEKEKMFFPVYEQLIKKFKIKLRQDFENSFLEKWYIQHIRDEIDFVFNLIEKIADTDVKNISRIILSRTMRSCRATTHADLATIYEPITAPYYCSKHGKICKPLFSIMKWWETYSKDTVKRLIEFNSLRTQTYQICLSGDSRNINLIEKLKDNQDLHTIIMKNKIAGIFSSPPYIGLIDYHEQHAYAYDVFGLQEMMI